MGGVGSCLSFVILLPVVLEYKVVSTTLYMYVSVGSNGSKTYTHVHVILVFFK